MPTLNWIGKNKIVNHDMDVPFKTLNKIYTFNEEESENMLIHGDNLVALKSLLTRYENKIQCVYIDPPYNTGKPEGYWVYSDNVDDPNIKKWLDTVVGKEDEFSRHDKWLCMMYPRLKLIRKLMSDDGVIFISIDDNELFNLKAICDEIFGLNNFISLLSVEINPKGRKNSSFISVSNDYCLIYAKNKNNSKFIENIPKNKNDLSLDDEGNLVHNSGKRVLVGENSFNKIISDINSDKHYVVYYNKDTKLMELRKEKTLEDIDFTLIEKGYKRYYSFSGNDFVENTYTMDKFYELYTQHALDFKENKIYEKNFNSFIRMKSMIVNKEYEIYKGTDVVKYKIDVKTTSAGTELKAIFNTSKTIFPNPKNKNFIKLLISLIDNKNCYVLDCFAGSGTTAHAVLDINNDDGGNRKFISVEMMDYAENITSERIKRVINGYSDVEGLPGDFTFYELGEDIFVNNNLNQNVSLDDLRKYIYYSATKDALPNINFNNKYLLGIKEDISYYFYYEKDQTCVLDFKFLSTIDIKTSHFVIYADACTICEEDLEKYHITFKKTPRDITKF